MVLGDFLKSEIRKELKKRTDEILVAVKRLDKGQARLTIAIDEWIAFMEKAVKELKD